MRHLEVSWPDRVASALSYLSGGWVGLFYCVFLYLTKRHITRFARFNAIQSVFLALAYFVLNIASLLLFKFLFAIPFIRILASQIIIVFSKPLLFGYSITDLVVVSVIGYCVGYCMAGEYPMLYKISDNFKR